jgi:hypothetical protein
MTKTITFKYTKEKSQPKITVYKQGCGMSPPNLDQEDMTARQYKVQTGSRTIRFHDFSHYQHTSLILNLSLDTNS